MSAIVEKFKLQGGTLKSHSSSTGRVVAVYDGRSWPVVKCGAVYVTDDDKTKTVTKNILSQSTISDDKKIKSSKYSLAIGSSFGHIHTFLKDSDNVLKSLDKQQTEDKCLMLIRKPKSASKQMLKAYSWADLSGHDLPLCKPDGTLTKDVYHQFKNRGKRKPDLSLPPEETLRGQHSPRIANHSSPLRVPSNQNSSHTELQSVENTKGKTKSNVLREPLEHNSDAIVPSPELSRTYSTEKNSKKSTTERMKANSNSDVCDIDSALNGDGMGSIISQRSSKSHKSPPAVPEKPSKKSKNRNDSSQSSRQAKERPRSFNSDSNNSSRSKPDVIAHVNGNRSNSSQKQESTNRHYPGSRTKHDSGFHSDLRLDNDMMYQQGFKQDLHGSANTGHMLTSSPLAECMQDENAKLSKASKRHIVSASCDNLSVMRPEPQYYKNGQGESGRSAVSGISQGCTKPRRAENDRGAKGADSVLSLDRQSYQGYGSYGPQKPMRNDSHAADKKQSQQYVESEKNYRKSSPQTQQYNGRVAHSKSSPHLHSQNYNQQSHQTSRSDISNEGNSSQAQEYSRSGSYQINSLQQQHVGRGPNNKQRKDNEKGNSPNGSKSRSGKDYNKRKSLGDICEGKIVTIESEEPVSRAQSMGDLSAGCTFSIVGQKKIEGFQGIGAAEFTGSQMVKHFRKYREMKDTQHGSLPFRGKTLDEVYEDGGSQRLDNMQFQALSIKENDSVLSEIKPKHYGSLQHLPSEGSGGMKEIRRQAVPVAHREQTPLKPRRCLPQVPGDVDERKKHFSDLVKVRASANSFTSSSPSTGNSTRAGSSVARPEGVSATPSDREVSDLLVSNHSNNYAWTSSEQPVCNINDITGSNFSKSYTSLPDPYLDHSQKTLRKSVSVSSHDHAGNEHVAPSGGRLSEIEQTTLTSQSTTDSGYITNDPDQEVLSTSSYALTLKQSAQSLYSGKKLFKPSKGDTSQVYAKLASKGNNSYVSEVNGHVSNAEGGNSQFSIASDAIYHEDIPKGSKSNCKSARDSNTRNWVEKHPPHTALKTIEMEPASKQHGPTDSNNNKNVKRPEKSVAELGHCGSNILCSDENITPLHPQVKKQTLSHHTSDLTVRDVGKLTQKSKGKSLSMSQGLNLLDNPSFDNKSSMLSKSHPKFTGSLKDLLGEDRYIVPIESLKLENFSSNSTLPGSWKFQGGGRPETSLKMLGKPSLFQLLQNYNLYPVRVVLSDKVNIVEQLRMIDCEVVLPKPWQCEKESPMSPKGSYAKLGGPNSAFKPVASGGGCPIGTVSMVTVMEVSNQIRECFETGFINKGDLIVEVNEKLMMGEDLVTLTNMLQSCQGELLLTVARDKARDSHRNRGSTPSDEDFRIMEQKIHELTKELRKRDNTLKQLNSMMLWKQNTKGQSSNGIDEPYICNLSEDEFIV